MPAPHETFAQTYEAFFKTTRTSRGLTYRYLSVPGANPALPTLLWLHGFPSSAYDWHYQVDHFRAKGYALIVPDMLGYGGSDKPADVTLYTKSKMARDVVDILDAEGASRVVAVGHDMGAFLLGRVVDLYADRFVAFAFVSVGYVGPNPNAPHDLDTILAFTKKFYGKEVYAYWGLLTKEGGDKIIADNFESFLDVLYAKDAFNAWDTYLMEKGKLEEFVASGARLPRASYVPEEDYTFMRDHLIGPGRGLAGPCSWYKASTTGANVAEDKEVVAKLGENFPVSLSSQPVLYVGTTQDAVCAPSRMRPPTEKLATDFTAVELDTSHWPFLERPEEFNAAVEKWLEAKVLTA